MPRSSSRVVTAAPASSPKAASGVGSGVTSDSSAAGAASRTAAAACSASSYSGSAQVVPPGTTNATRRIAPSRSAVDHVAHAPDVLRAAEGQRAGHGLGRARAEREHERVVLEPGAVLRLDHAIVGVDPRDGVAHERHRAVGGDRRDREALHAAGRERLRDGERAVREVPIRREQLDRRAIARERLQREHGLQARHSGPRHQDAHGLRAGHAATVNDGRGRSIGAGRAPPAVSPQRRVEEADHAALVLARDRRETARVAAAAVPSTPPWARARE